MQPHAETWSCETSEAYAGLLRAFNQALDKKHPRLPVGELSRQLAIRELINHLTIPPSSNTQNTFEYPAFNQYFGSSPRISFSDEVSPHSRNISPNHSIPTSTVTTVLWTSHRHTANIFHDAQDAHHTPGAWSVSATAQPLLSHCPVASVDTGNVESFPRSADRLNDTMSDVIPSSQVRLDDLRASYDKDDQQQKTLADGSMGFFVQTPASMTHSSLLTWKKNVSQSALHKTSNKVKQLRKGRPKRALTAYNLFFKEERERILTETRRQHVHAHVAGNRHDNRSKRDGGAKIQSCSIGFKEMGKIIGLRWKELDSEMRLIYEKRAKADKQRYSEELTEYMKNARNEREAKLASLQASVSEETKERYFSKRN